jgi:hypothetical protein
LHRYKNNSDANYLQYLGIFWLYRTSLKLYLKSFERNWYPVGELFSIHSHPFRQGIPSSMDPFLVIHGPIYYQQSQRLPMLGVFISLNTRLRSSQNKLRNHQAEIIKTLT